MTTYTVDGIRQGPNGTPKNSSYRLWTKSGSSRTILLITYNVPEHVHVLQVYHT